MKKKKKDLFFREKGDKKLPMEFNPIGSFLCLFIERMTFGLEWQIVFGIAGVNSGIADGAGGGTGEPEAIGAPVLTRSTFHARILLNQRSFH